MTDEPKDEWRTLHQVLPLPVYVELLGQLSRIARVNGISVEAFHYADKTKQEMGLRVIVWEILTILLRETGDAGLRQ